MSKQSMVLFRITRLNHKKMLFESKEHVPRGCREHDTQPAFTKLDLTKKKFGAIYFEAEITHREGIAMEGFWHGQRIHEVVSESLLASYYNLDRNVLIIEAPHALASAAVRRLDNDCREDIRLTRVRIDFNHVLSKTPGLTVLGAWTSSPKEMIRSRAAFSGVDLQKQKDFKLMRKSGELSNISVSYPFGVEDLRVNVSRWCAAFFLEPVALERRLQFMEHLATFEVKQKPRRRGSTKAA
jgi:hypothetical protein